MKASTLIRGLTKLIRQHGDIEVRIRSVEGGRLMNAAIEHLSARMDDPKAEPFILVEI